MTNNTKTCFGKLLHEAHERGAVLCGISAGYICWAEGGLSDSEMYTNPTEWKPIRVAGLGMLPFVAIPHWDDQGSWRKPFTAKMLRGTRQVGIALEQDAPLVVVDNEWRIMNSRKGKKAYKLFWRGDEFVVEPILPSEEFRPLPDLISY